MKLAAGDLMDLAVHGVQGVTLVFELSAIVFKDVYCKAWTRG